MLLSGDLAVFMQPRCCLPALKPSPIMIKFEDCAKSDFQSPRVPPDTGELARGGAESLSAPTAGWPPCNQNIGTRMIRNLCQSDTTLLGAQQILRILMFHQGFDIEKILLCIFDEVVSGHSFCQFGNVPGVFQGVRLSRKLPNGCILQPQVVDEVI